MQTFFTSDSHFGDARALALHRRPFASVAAMDGALIAQWNARIGSDDEVWHLGDFAIGPDAARVAALLDQLQGCKHLVTGNNDSPAVVSQSGWASVQPYAERTMDGVLVVMCHYAFRTWNGMSRKSINLHGHSHGRLAPWARQADVGVDAWAFRPVTLAEIRTRWAKD